MVASDLVHTVDGRLNFGYPFFKTFIYFIFKDDEFSSDTLILFETVYSSFWWVGFLFGLRRLLLIFKVYSRLLSFVLTHPLHYFYTLTLYSWWLLRFIFIIICLWNSFGLSFFILKFINKFIANGSYSLSSFGLVFNRRSQR